MVRIDRLEGKTVLVVGGGRAIGLEIARRVADAGAEVVVGVRDVEGSEPGIMKLKRVRAERIDIADEASIESCAERIGAVDHVVATASAHHNAPVTELDHGKTVGAFEAKAIGPLMLAKHFAPRMGEGGSFLFFSGVAAWKPSPGRSVMGITNGAVEFLSSHLAAELAPVRVNAISPGIVDSGLWDGMGESAKEEFFTQAAAGTLAGRVGLLEDIADAALWLMEAGFTSGETIHVEGGARHR